MANDVLSAPAPARRSPMTCRRSRLSRRLGAVLLAVGVALCAGCGGSPHTPGVESQIAVSPSAGSQGPNPGLVEPSPSVTSDVANGSDADATGTLASVGPPPADTPSTQRAAVDRAVA